MELFTALPVVKSSFALSADTPVLMLGSCFSDNVGTRLLNAGMPAVVNPTGPLYNPLSLAAMAERCLTGEMPTPEALSAGPRGWHCLEYASRYSGPDARALLDKIAGDLQPVVDFLGLDRPRLAVFTFGTAYVFHLAQTGMPVGNCHKFPATAFERRLRSAEDFVARWLPIVRWLTDLGVHCVFTVSPIRHMADGAHGNTVSKSTLHLAIDQLCSKTHAEYFPAYEIMNDWLRDYRFYAADMVHPSEVAVDIIYGHFLNTFCTPAVKEKLRLREKENRRNGHRQILE